MPSTQTIIFWLFPFATLAMATLQNVEMDEAETNDAKAFIQSLNAPSWSISHDGVDKFGEENEENEENPRLRVRPYRRYIFDVPRFARPPDPHVLWRQFGEEQLQQQQQQRALEPFDDVAGGVVRPIPQIPQAIRNYFALDAQPEKVVKELTGVDLRSILGHALDHLIEPTTSTPAWTRPTTPKGKLVEYFERSLDNFLAGRFRPMERVPYLLEQEKLLEMNKNGTGTNDTVNAPDVMHSEDQPEGSGEAPEDQNSQNQNDSPIRQSSIAGIPKQMPFIPKVPLEFFAARQDDSEVVNAQKHIEMEKDGQKLREEPSEIRRHPVNPDFVPDSQIDKHEGLPLTRTMKEYYQYGAKPTHQQGVLSALLDFFGINNQQAETVELDKVLTEWLVEHAPKQLTKAEQRAHRESSYNQMQQLLSQPVMPLCTTQPQVLDNFDVDAFMGQWFEVMYSSPLLTTTKCTVVTYKMLGRTNHPGGVGSLFQSVQFSQPKTVTEPSPILTSPEGPQFSSGYGIVSRPGQMVFRRSNSPEEVIVHVIDAGYSTKQKRYEWAILGINCNYPIYVLAREPLVFKQKYERLVAQVLERRGLISEISRLLNLVRAIEPDSYQMPTHFFT